MIIWGMNGLVRNLDELKMANMSTLGTLKMNEHLRKIEKAIEEEFAKVKLNERNLVNF